MRDRDGRWRHPADVSVGSVLSEQNLLHQMLPWLGAEMSLGWALKQHWFRHPDGQQTHETMLNVTHHQGDTNQSHTEIPPHTGQSC